MSSHHFVREGQEPALFIVDASSLNSIASLLEWAPLVMVLDTALETVLSWGVKIDAVVASLDNLAAVEQMTHEQFPLQIFSYRHGEDALVVGLTHLLDDQEAVHIIAQALDHTFAVLAQFSEKINVVLLDDALRWVPVLNGYDKWLPAKTFLAVRKDRVQKINYTGLVERQENLFEVVADGRVTLQSDATFWLAETIQ